jgi:hypothetical protein
MSGRVSRRLPVALLALVLPWLSCGQERGYLTDKSFRRAALVASLATPHNEYAALRLSRYATGDAADWEARPEWNPAVVPLAVTDGAPAPAYSLPISAAAKAGDREALRAIGEAAFFRYPTQLVPYAERLVGSPALLARYGFWTDGNRAGGLLRVVLADGSLGLALSCATCHARIVAGELSIGVGNDLLDLGALIHDAGLRYGAELRQAAATWGPGRVDVATEVGNEPVRIPDLRPVRWLTHLQQAAAVQQRDVNSLAVRIETLLITAHGGAVRPPRPVALGLAIYLWSLAERLPLPVPQTPDEQRGAALFADRCEKCHVPPGYAGPPIAYGEIGTEPTLARSRARGTGGYRVPSLRGVATRGALLHDATLPDLAALLDPARLLPGYSGRHGSGPVPGHTYGLDLEPVERTALLAFLRRL